MLKKSKKELMIIKKRIDAMDIERRRLLSFSPSLSVLVHDWFVDFERMVPVRTPEEAMAHYVWCVGKTQSYPSYANMLIAWIIDEKSSSLN